jgi:transcriptional regulator of met regulon
MKHYIFLLSTLITLCISSLPITNAYAAEIPLPVYNRYFSLASALEEMQNKEIQKITIENNNEVNKVLVKDIAAFYQQQLPHSTERQLLSGSLYLQLLLAQQEYKESYQVVTQLLTLPLNQNKQLAYHQLAGQIAAQIHTPKEKKSTSWPLVIDHLSQWFLILEGIELDERIRYKITNKQEAENAALLAQAYYLENKLNKALLSAKKAYYLFPKQEPYLKLLLAVLQALEKNQELNNLLKIAVTTFPHSEDYWHRLAYNYLNLKNNEKALSTLAIIRNQGLLTKQGYQILGSLYLQQQQPRIAAEVYQEGVAKKLLDTDKYYFDNLINAWLMARDRSNALIALKQAQEAGFATQQQTIQKAQLLYIEGQWAEAEQAYQSLLKPLLSDKIPQQENAIETTSSNEFLIKDKWRFLLAMSQIEQNKTKEARINLLQLQTEQYKGYGKEWLKQLQ